MQRWYLLTFFFFKPGKECTSGKEDEIEAITANPEQKPQLSQGKQVKQAIPLEIHPQAVPACLSQNRLFWGMDQPTETGEALVSAQVPFYTKSVWKARSTIYYWGYSVDVELNSDPKGNPEQNCCLLCTRTENNSKGQWAARVQNEHKTRLPASVKGHWFVLYGV